MTSGHPEGPPEFEGPAVPHRVGQSGPQPVEGTAYQHAVGKVELRGVDYIPEEERVSNPSNLMKVFIGAQLSFTVIVIGWLPITFGLGWWSTVTAVTVGLIVGTAVYAPFALFGPKTGTNSAVSTGAHFGVVGRLLGTFLALFIALGFYGVTVWTGGEAVIGGMHRLFDTPETDVALGIGYALMAAITVLVAIYGHASVVAAQKFVIATIGLLVILGFIVLIPDFDGGYSGGEYLLGGFWATWTLSAITAASIPISYGPFANDYSRYISVRHHSEGSIVRANAIGMFAGCWFVMIFGAYVAVAFAGKDLTFVQGFISVSPTWYVVGIILMGLLGTFAQGALCIYGTGLDTSSLIPRLPRPTATFLLGLCGVALVFLGAFVWEAIDTISAFVILLTIVTTPWLVINTIGYFHRKGWYSPDDLQVFNRGERGGLYWFTHGLNLRAFAAWIPAVVVGLLFSQTTLFVGAWATAVEGGVDMSFISAGVVGGAVYGLLLLLFPEKPEVSGRSPERHMDTSAELAVK